MPALTFFIEGSSTAVKTYTPLTPVQIAPLDRDKNTFQFTDATGDKCVSSNLPFIVEN